MTISSSLQPVPFPSIIRRDIELLHERKFYLEGFFEVDLIDARSGLIKEHYEFRNLLTDAGMNAIGTTGNTLTTLFQYMGVGTGNTAPANNQTALVAEILPRTLSNGGTGDTFTSGPSFDYWEGTRVRLFVEAEANGTLAELGLFNAATAGTMSVRQLFKDSGGTPITIVKTSSDQLRITYKWRIYPDTTSDTQTITITGVSTLITNRAYDIDNTGAWGQTLLTSFGSWTNHATAWENDVLPSTTGVQSGSNAAMSSAIVQAYGSGNFYRDIEFKWEPAVANFATGIGSITSAPHASSNSNSISTFSPKIAKDNTKRVTLMSRYSWARHP